MDPGPAALVLAVLVLAAIYAAPMAWRRAAGGLLIVLTVLITALQLLGAL